ncbi:MAG TPA: DUF4340 domain-containing protein [Armatimonadota bacterium]|nr:DUF4340 domain-containing protein [Armatimonadota bacterium]HOJ20135.1 DUF4340 domain-containing protein [Armatimonadota bacterium]HOM80548.1 DUF4340 domain-containing protein [Armatimonadota bacterium]HPO71407.1 DUF4340 domain-containing protein [Armatimonadota bacterium]HPT97771.1 DUF4340 domain-containing protein [Armatimonadota bacterium]
MMNKQVMPTIVGAVILALLGGYVYFFERGKAPEEGGARPLSRVLGYKADRVWKLQIDRENDPIWIVRQKDRRGQMWRMEKPLKALADGEEATRLITELSDTTVERVLTENTSDLKPFGLDQPAWEITLATDDGKTHTLLVGGKDPGGSLLYLKPKERSDILVVSSYSLDGLQMKVADELRDKSVIGFKKEEVQRFELTAEGQTIRVERAGADAWKITAPVVAKARKEKVNSILMTFERLKGTKIVADSPKDLKPYGLDKPSATVAVWVKGEKEPRVALLGSKDSSGDLYAKGAHNPAVVTVYSYVLSDAQSKVEDIKEPDPEPEKKEKKPANEPGNAPAEKPAANEPAANGPTIDKPIPKKEAPAKE